MPAPSPTSGARPYSPGPGRSKAAPPRRPRPRSRRSLPATSRRQGRADGHARTTVTLVSVVVPVYYNSATLSALLERLRAVAVSLPDLDFEFVFTDDGSGDNSFAILTAEAAQDSRVRAQRLSRNFGSNAAILAGLSRASGDCCVVTSADL